MCMSAHLTINSLYFKTGIMILLDLLEPLGHNKKFHESVNTYEKHKHKKTYFKWSDKIQ